MSFGLVISLLLAKYPTYGQVNLQTGSAIFSLPLFDWKDHKSSLNAMIALNYNSGNGLKTNEVASNMGQGWSLIAGGMITRMQVGEPDDQKERSGNLEDINKYPNGYLYASAPAYQGAPTAVTKYPLYPHRNQLYKPHNSVTEDRQLDYFTFQFNGKSGMFVLNAPSAPTYDGPSGDVGIPLGDTKLKITFQRDETLLNQGIRTTITSFIIQDVDGLLYKFSNKSLSKVLDVSYCDRSLSYVQTQPNFKEGKIYYQSSFETRNEWIIDGWFLSEVRDPFTSRVVTFSYGSPRMSANYAGADFSYNESSKYAIITHKKSVIQCPELSQIIFPDGHSAQFTYAKDRVDLPGMRALTSIDIKYTFEFKTRTISRYLLNTSYFILNRYGTPVTAFQKSVARLCLRSIKKIGVDLKEDSPPYQFDYYTGSDLPDDIVPPPYSYKKDIWGFYNGDNSVDYNYSLLNTSISTLDYDDVRGLCFLRYNQGGTLLLNPKHGYAKNGLLKQIIYPTGGTLSYEYDQNWGTLNNVLQRVGGVHVSVTSATDGTGANGCANPIRTIYNYVLDQTGTSSSLWGIENPRNQLTITNYYNPEKKTYTGLSCSFKYKYPGILSMQQAINLTTAQQLLQVFSVVAGIVSTATTILDVVQFIAAGTGVGALIIDAITTVINIAITCLHDYSKLVTTNIYYNYDLNGASPLPVQFKRVEVSESSGNNGKTVYEFTSEAQYPVWFPRNEALSAKQRFASWAYGLPLKTTVYNANGKKVRQTENEYDTTYAKRLIKFNDKSFAGIAGIKSQLVSCKYLVIKSTSQRVTDYSAMDPGSFLTGSTSDLLVDFNGYYTGRVNLKTTYERSFDENDETRFVQTITRYSYNELANYEVNTITAEQSNGDLIKKTFTYSSDDYTGGSAIYALQANNVIALPVTTTTANQAGLLYENRIEYVQLGSGVVMTGRLLERRYNTPGQSTTPSFMEVRKFVYDSDGNLVTVKDEGARVVSNVYDNDGKYVTAAVVNADFSPVNGVPVDKCAYTSFETKSLGGWTVTGTLSPPSLVSISGNQAFLLSTANSLSASSLNVSKVYKLTFWSSGTVSVSSGAILKTTGPTLKGLTYYEYELPLGAAQVTLTGASTIDELRLYPKTARMQTMTYDPLIGKTSECDENNRIVYYEYDNLGRMRMIRDEKGNIVKMYEYNNVSKQVGCPTIYYSHYTKEVFSRNNCVPGNVGGDVEYTITAGKYTSAISQEDADAQVQNELLTQAQAFANANGSCTKVYTNALQSKTVTSESCGPGFVGGQVTYSVPAGRYVSTISQANADQQASTEIDANIYTYANSPEHRVCTPVTTPQWSWESNTYECRIVSGQNHMFILEVDINPSSSSYNSPRWTDVGPSTECSNCASCSGAQYACIGGVCETGVRVNTDWIYDPESGLYNCIYHYEWSDGSWSPDYVQKSTQPCIIN